MNKVLCVLLAGALALCSAAARAEVVAPDDPGPEAKAPVQQGGETKADGGKAPMVVDEPDFKIKLAVPEKTAKVPPATKPKSGLLVPNEEGTDDDGQPSAPGTEAGSKEEISAALARAIAKEKGGKPAREMVKEYQAVTEAEPDNAAAQYRLGLAFARGGDQAKSLAALEKAVALQPANPKYQCDYGLIALQTGALDKALTACLKAELAAPSNGRYHNAVGDCFLVGGRPTDAADAYNRAIHAAPHNPEFIHNLGVVHLQAGAYKKAIEMFNEAIRLRPECSQYYCSRGLAKMDQEDGKGAVRDYILALTLDKNNAYAHFLLASAYSNPDDPTLTSSVEAVEHAEKAVKLTQYGNAQYLMGLARALRVARKYDKAAEAAKKAVALEPRADFKKELVEFERLCNEGIR